MSDWVGTKKAVGLLGVSPTTLRRWADDGHLPYIRTAGGHRRYKLSDLEELIAHHEESLGDSAELFGWVRMLREARIDEIRNEIRLLRSTNGDWFVTADFLGRVTVEIGRCWADGEFSLVDEHLATGKLNQSLALLAADLVVADDAPVAILATLSNEHHTLGLSLASLCIRSVAIDAQWIGADTPYTEVAQFVSDSADPPNVIMLSASEWSTDYVMLHRACRKIGAACHARGTALVIGGKGHWPDLLEYGERCRSFTDLKQTLGRLGLIAKTQRND